MSKEVERNWLNKNEIFCVMCGKSAKAKTSKHRNPYMDSHFTFYVECKMTIHIRISMLACFSLSRLSTHNTEYLVFIQPLSFYLFRHRSAVRLVATVSRTRISQH